MFVLISLIRVEKKGPFWSIALLVCHEGIIFFPSSDKFFVVWNGLRLIDLGIAVIWKLLSAFQS